MRMLESDRIPELVRLFTKRDVHLYHACQYKDFCSYLALHGVPSRKQLEEEGLAMTGFTSDRNDRQNDVWDKIFLNLQDFGQIFSRGRSGVPTPYGPILFRFEPAALYQMTDIAICLRSAGAADFDREREALKSIEDVDRIFPFPADDARGEPPHGRTAVVKFGSRLQEEFGRDAGSVEISCTTPDGVLSFNYLEDILVDPYDIQGRRLTSLVNDTIQKAGFSMSVKERDPGVGSERYQYLLRGAGPRPIRPTKLVRDVDDRWMQVWAQTIARRDGEVLYNYERYLQYLYEGTVEPIVQLIESEKEPPRRDRAIELSRVFPAEEIPASWLDMEDRMPWLDSEYDLLTDDIADDELDWARSSEDGWFYDDNY